MRDLVKWVDTPTPRDEATMDERTCHVCGDVVGFSLTEVHDTYGSGREEMRFYIYGTVDGHDFCESCAMEFEVL